MNSRWLATVAAAFLAACNVDALLEEEVPPAINLSVAVANAQLSLSPGGMVTVDASITRLGDYTGNVSFSFANVPEGVTVSVGTLTTTGKTSTATITFAANPSLATNTYIVTIRANVGTEAKSSAEVALQVAPLPGVGVLPIRQSLSVIRGGISPFNVLLTRTNYTDAVSLSVSGAAGVSVAFPGGVTGPGISATLSVATSVAPGTYQMTLRATGVGIPPAEAPFTVIVPADPLQLVVEDAASTQAAVVSRTVIINRFGISAPIALSATGLPSGVSVSFPEGTTSGTTTTARFTIAASTTPGNYPVTLRGEGGGTEASASFTLAIGPSNVGMTLVPQNVTLLQGTAAASLLTVLRTSFEGVVSVQILSTPAGVQVSASEPTVTGGSTTLLVQVARNVAPGSYPVTVRVVPAPTEIDGPALDPVTTSLTVTVLESPTVNANVVLDWSACAAPAWVAAQDGTGPWTRLTNVQGRFAFALTSVRGGFAWDEGGTGIIVRFMTSAELTAGPINLCVAPPPATFSVSGTAQHVLTAESATWRLGGGVGSSTSAVPNFTMEGVRSGVHDLVGWANTTAFTTKMVLVRDVSQPAGGSVGTVSTSGPESFTPSSTPLTIPGLGGERLALTLSYLTTAACTENELWQGGSSSVSGTYFGNIPGVPSLFQRNSDYHLITAVASGTNIVRTSSVSYNRVSGSRSMTMPPATPITFATLAGSYQRLRAVVQQMPTEYNTRMTLRFTSNGRTGTVSATAGTFPSGIVLLDFPDLGGVEGFPGASLPPTGSHGTFSAVLEGTSGEASLCADETTRRTLTRSGPF